MSRYKLNEQAKHDLRRIYRHGFETFGERQADAYFHAFFRRFEQIAEQPFLYAAVDYIKAGYRRSVCGADSIYYRIVGGTVEIMRILGRQEAGEELDERSR